MFLKHRQLIVVDGLELFNGDLGLNMTENENIISKLSKDSFYTLIAGFRESCENADDSEHGLKLFFSLDIVNSSHFKEIAENNWAEIITDLMNYIVAQYLEINSFAFPWRVIGDELIFVVPVKSLDLLRKDVHSFYEFFKNRVPVILKKVQEKREQGDYNTYSFNMLSFKACAWIAYTVDFDTPSEKLIDNLKKVRSYNVSKQYNFCREQNLLEFLGNDIDAGFRISRFTRRDHFCVSFELAYLLSKETEYFKRLHIISYQKLKGVWDNKWYPIIWYHDNEVARCKFEDSFRYYEPDGDELILSCLNIDDYRIKHFGFLGEDMFEVSSAFERIIDGNLLKEKINFLEKYDADNPSRNAIRIKDNHDEFHIAVVCINNDSKALILHRKDKNRWEFGCCKSSSNKALQSVAVEEYRRQYGIEIEVVIDCGREDQQPIPIALYSLQNDSKIKKGLIFLAKLSESQSVLLQADSRYDDYKFISEEEIKEFEDANKGNLIKDFSATLYRAFVLWRDFNESQFN